MRPIEKCLPIIRDILTAHPLIPLHVLAAKAHERIGVNDKTLRLAIAACVDSRSAKTSAVKNSRRLAYSWVDEAPLPVIEERPKEYRSFDHPKQSTVPAMQAAEILV